MSVRGGGFEDNQVRNQTPIRTGAHDHEVEATVGRGKSKYGVVTVRRIERAFRKKLTFDGRRSSSRALLLDDRALLPAN